MEYILVIGGALLLMYLYMKEKSDHTKTKNELAVLKRMGELDELGKKLEDDRQTYDESLANHTEHLIPDFMLTELGRELPTTPDLSPRPVLETAPADKPIFFTGIATTDIREGQKVDIEVRPEEGRTYVTGNTPTPGISIAAAPTES